jgi:hypothetical protein
LSERENVATSKKASKKNQQGKSSSKGPVKKQTRKKRGALLSILIFLIGIHAILGILVTYSYLKQDYIGQKPWILGVLIAVSVANLVAAVGIWYWKQWGIYVYILTTVVAATMSIVLTGNVWASLYQFIPVAILGYVISLQNKQKLFE